MELTLTAECWTKFCMQLTKVMCLHNFFNLFYRPSYGQVKRSAPQAISPYSKQNNTFMDLMVNCFTPALIDSAGFDQYLVICDLLAFQQPSQPQRHLAQALVALLRCISVCLTSLTLCTFNSGEKWFLHLARILWQSVTKSPFSSFTILVLKWQPFLQSLMPLYKFLMFLILLLVSSSSISDIPSFCS